MMKKKYLICIWVIAGFRLTAQTPACSASWLYLYNFQPTGLGDIAQFVLSVPANVDSFVLEYEYGAPAPAPLEGPEEFGNTAPEFTLPLVPTARRHRVTARNQCIGGTAHHGATLELLTDDPLFSYNCPTPYDLQIEVLTPNFIQFSWAFDAVPDFWHVLYEPAGLAPQSFDTPVPSVMQPLAPGAIVHYFSIYAVCDFPQLQAQIPAHSATIRFKVVVVEDIKLLTIPCDTLREATSYAYQLRCTNPMHYNGGDYGPDKERFLIDHSCYVVGTGEPFTADDLFDLAPNPASGLIRLVWRKDLVQGAVVEIRDINGRVRIQVPVLPKENSISTIPASGLQAGWHVIRLQWEGKTVIKPFLIW